MLLLSRAERKTEKGFRDQPDLIFFFLLAATAALMKKASTELELELELEQEQNVIMVDDGSEELTCRYLSTLQLRFPKTPESNWVRRQRFLHSTTTIDWGFDTAPMDAFC